MSTEILLVEPRGYPSSALSALKVARMRVQGDLRSALARYSASLLWIAPSQPALNLLLKALPPRPRPDLRLLALNPFTKDMQNFLHAHFRFVVCASKGVHLLPLQELAEVLNSEGRADLLIGGEAVEARSELLLYRGNLEPISVPLAWFVPRPSSPEPDIRRLAITDYGQTVRVGEYEASTDAILYEFDDDYRVRAKKRLRQQDSSFGGALRRLRLLKGLRQSDFPGVTAKEIARIENGQVKKPHEDTLRKIAQKTGVPVEEIHTY